MTEDRETAWLIEMQGPAWLAARKLGNYHFHWVDDANKAIRFHSFDQADIVMMAIRQDHPELFPAILVRDPRPTEHMWLTAAPSTSNEGSLGVSASAGEIDSSDALTAGRLRQAEEVKENGAFAREQFRDLVDRVWMYAFEDDSVPATDVADKIINEWIGASITVRDTLAEAREYQRKSDEAEAVQSRDTFSTLQRVTEYAARRSRPSEPDELKADAGETQLEQLNQPNPKGESGEEAGNAYEAGRSRYMLGMGRPRHGHFDSPVRQAAGGRGWDDAAAGREPPAPSPIPPPQQPETGAASLDDCFEQGRQMFRAGLSRPEDGLFADPDRDISVQSGWDHEKDGNADGEGGDSKPNLDNDLVVETDALNAEVIPAGSRETPPELAFVDEPEPDHDPVVATQTYMDGDQLVVREITHSEFYKPASSQLDTPAPVPQGEAEPDPEKARSFMDMFKPKVMA